MTTLLIIEDDPVFMDQIRLSLEDSYSVITCSTISQAIKSLNKDPVDGIITEYLLKDGTALDLFSASQSLKEKPKCIIMTAHAEKDMAISCLNAGVRGFIEKPFERAALQNLIEVHFPIKPSQKKLTVDKQRRMLNLNGNEFSLTEIEFQIVSHFLQSQNQWVSRKQLSHILWGDLVISRNTLDTHLLNLKNKIPPLKNAIVNLRGHGYHLDENKIS